MLHLSLLLQHLSGCPDFGSGPEGLQTYAEEGVCFCGAQTKEEVTSPPLFSSLSHISVGQCDPGVVRDDKGGCGGSHDCPEHSIQLGLTQRGGNSLLDQAIRDEMQPFFNFMNVVLLKRIDYLLKKMP